ncbi:MAG: hypothetical protein IPG71_13945 [bacterium]|nr:hypothetical protein [bacterium]
MNREEFLAATNAYLERLMMAVHELPEVQLHQPITEGAHSVCELFSILAVRAESIIRALDRLYQGLEPELAALPVKSNPEFKRAQSALRIAHTTVSAALERIPLSRLDPDGNLPGWLCDNYLKPLEGNVPVIEQWAKDLRARGLAGPAGLPVIQ